MNGSGHEATSTPPRRSHWRWLRRLLTLAFFVLVPVLLFLLVKNLDWQEVRHALGEYRPATLFLGLLLAAAGYTVFSSFDLLSRYYIGHSLPKRRVFTVAFVCNAFNLNLSSWVGAVALRYRLYSRLGLDIADITRILTFSLVTNWFGYLLLAGILFSCGLPALPPGWKLGSDGLRLIGALLLALAAGYLLACRFARRRAWGWREHRLTLPSWRLAALQGLLGASNWSLMALLLYSLLPHSVDYPSVLAILLISSIAGVITHIPAGLGVLEAVFIALLQGRLSQGVLLAALIGYRVLYFLLPWRWPAWSTCCWSAGRSACAANSAACARARRESAGRTQQQRAQRRQVEHQRLRLAMGAARLAGDAALAACAGTGERLGVAIEQHVPVAALRYADPIALARHSG